jgi:methionine synthase I (cobalamin-dependent)
MAEPLDFKAAMLERTLLVDRILLLDGAMGTELERFGIDTRGRAWTSRANLTDPDMVTTVHTAYIDAGADIITANTFRTNRRSHEGTTHDPKYLTERALKLARAAREQSPDHTVWIAGSIAPVEDCFKPEAAPASDDELRTEHSEMVRWLVDGGADIILIETMSTLREAKIALEAARAVSTLPTIISLVPKDGETLLDGTSIDAAFQELSQLAPDVIALNCAPLSIMKLAAKTASEASKKYGVPFGLYANASEKKKGEWVLIATEDFEFASAAEEWIALGAKLIGSCCGSTPNTTRALRTAITQLA